MVPEAISLEDYINDKIISPQKGVAYYIGHQRAPINNRPTYYYNGSVLNWIREIGLMASIAGRKMFLNPINRRVCFLEIEDCPLYLKNLEDLKKNSPKNQKYGRI